MRATTILAIVAIVAASGAVTSYYLIHQASAAPGEPKVANGEGNAHSNPNAINQGTANANSYTPLNQPWSVYC